MKDSIIFNPRCSKSRKALEILEEKGLNVDQRNYLENPLNVTEVESLLTLLGKNIKDVVRTKEDDYKNNNLADVSEAELIAAVEKYPIILERPIFVYGGKAVVARPPEDLTTIL